ncbi:MAG: LacI family transcriptional regulator [Chloroflexi bacterium]|nr:MAG: LacI family transcriptional regulator [Chloroflexota bacterium]
MPTLQDVAKLAGVSTATVSKVLSNTPYFTEETREKVMKAVRELGYVPNLAARALSSGKTHIISVVFPYVFDAIFQDPLVMAILEGVETECAQRGYNLLLSTPRLTKSGPDIQFQQLLQSSYMDGIIAIDNVPTYSVAQAAREHDMPAVVIGYHEHDYVVRSDDYSGGKKLIRHLLELGHRHIGIIGVPDNMNLAINQRLDGLYSAVRDAGIDPKSLPIVYGNYSTQSGAKALRVLLDEHPHLSAIVCLNDRMALGAIQEAKQLGYEVPERLSIVGYDDIPVSAIFHPSLTTIDQKAPQLGQQAAAMLFKLIEGKKPEKVVLPVELVVRQSSAAPPRTD